MVVGSSQALFSLSHIMPDCSCEGLAVRDPPFGDAVAVNEKSYA